VREREEMEEFTLLTSLPVIARKAGALVAIDDVTAHAALARGGRAFVDVCKSTISVDSLHRINYCVV
jgi:hypothetical protein